MAAAPFDLIEEARRLIAFNTVTWASNADCAVYLGSLLRRRGIPVFYQDVKTIDLQGNPLLFMNVAGMIGSGKSPLLLTTHLDTVDAGDPKAWTKNGGKPWRLHVRGDTLTGLGTADTKLDFLCKLWAVSQVKPTSLKRPVILLGTFGEESGLRGAARFCQGDLPKPAAALVGEPTELALVHRHKSLLVMEILFKTRGLHRPSQSQWVYEATFPGEAAHSSTPELGANALEGSLQFLRRLREISQKVAVLAWEGGTGHNILPASAQLRFCLGAGSQESFRKFPKAQVRARRLAPGWYPTLPWEQAVWAWETLGKLVAPYEKSRDSDFSPPGLTWNATWFKITKEGWSLTWDLRPLPGQTASRWVKRFEAQLWERWGPPGENWTFCLERENPALDLKKDEPLLQQAARALRAARLPVKFQAKPGCSEAGLYQKIGIPSLVFGPGRARGNIHRPNESVSLRQLKKAIRFYEVFFRKTCF